MQMQRVKQFCLNINVSVFDTFFVYFNTMIITLFCIE